MRSPALGMRAPGAQSPALGLVGGMDAPRSASPALSLLQMAKARANAFKDMDGAYYDPANPSVSMPGPTDPTPGVGVREAGPRGVGVRFNDPMPG